jgi:adenylate cyclase
MMELDELRTLALLLDGMALIEHAIVRCGGRLVDAPGDNVLAEFSNESAALRCALAIQRRFAERNLRLAEGEQLLLRIGLHGGDVLESGGKLYGKTVNIAARLQQAAAPGAVFLSDAVAERAESVLSRALLELGRFSYKNLRERVATFQAIAGDAALPTRPSH